MNEKLHKRNKSRTPVAEETSITAKNSYGRKLRGETAQSSALRSKFRGGKADTAISTKEIKKQAKMRKQGRKKSYADTILTAGIHHQVDIANEDNNAGVEAMNAGGQVVERGLYHKKMTEGKGTGKSGYSDKLHKQSKLGKKGDLVNEIQKKQTKKALQRKMIMKQRTKEAKSVERVAKKGVEVLSNTASRLVEAAAQNPMGLLLGVVILIVILSISGAMSSCSMLAGGGNGVVISTSFTAKDYVIVDVEEDYTALETALQDTINSIESTYPGYDEYNYSVADIGHDPFELASLLTILFNAYTESQVQDVLGMIYDYQYTFTVTEVVETRISIDRRYDFDNHEYYETQEEYEYRILNVSLTNDGIQAAVDSFGLGIGEMQRYQVMVDLKGNKPYVFD